MEFDNLVFVRELLDLLLIMDFGGENIWVKKLLINKVNMIVNKVWLIVFVNCNIKLSCKWKCVRNF